jgi:hypothetical protein
MSQRIRDGGHRGGAEEGMKVSEGCYTDHNSCL